MKNKLFKTTSRSNSEATAQKLFALLITTALSSAVFTTPANAQTAKSSSSSGAVGQKFANAGNGTGSNGPLLSNAVAGKLLLKADVGYVYSFAGDWNKSNSSSPSIGGNTSTATGGVGYGVSLGWTSKTGFGLSADYLGFNHKWTGLGTNDSTTQFNYDAPYHVMTITPNYRFKLDNADHWGLRVGLGVGFSLSDVNWAQKISASNGAQSGGARVAGGASYFGKEGVTLSDFGRSTALTGNCASLSSNTLLSDSQGSSLLGILGSGNAGKNKCNISGSPDSNAVAGFTDAEIATAVNNGKIALFESHDGDPIAYGVWSRVFGANATHDGVGNILMNPAVFETGAKVVMKADTWAGLNSDQQNKLVTAGVVYANNSDPAIEQCTSNGGTWTGSSCTPAPSATANTTTSPGGSAKDDAGFVLAPQVAVEYDSGMLHADLNVKYIHELFNVRYFGSEGSVSGTATSGAITYTSMAGPLALFIGAGLGVNF